MAEKILEVRDLTVHFYTYAGVVKAIEKVSFDVFKGETFALVGETGCGKSVTSRAITRLIESPGRIVGGNVYFYRNGEMVDLLSVSEEEIREIRGNEIAYIFQDPQSSLDPLYSVGYQVGEAMYVHGRVNSIKEGVRKAVEILKRVMIPDPEKRVKNYPHELSGGMKQRVVIGAGIANSPKLLVADEPTTALDVTVQAQVLDLMKKMKEDYGLSILLITHDMGIVADMADRVAVMYAGKIVESSDVYTTFKKAMHPYTIGLLKSVPNPLEKKDRLETIPGVVPNLISPPSGCRFHPRCKRATSVCSSKEPELVELESGHFVACHHPGEET